MLARSPSDEPEGIDPTDSLVGGRRQAVCKFFSTSKGFGFLLDTRADELDGEDVFVHYTSIDAVKMGPKGFRSLLEGEKVEYTLEKGATGYHAKHVTGPDGAPCIGAAPPVQHYPKQQFIGSRPSHLRRSHGSGDFKPHRKDRRFSFQGPNPLSQSETQFMDGRLEYSPMNSPQPTLQSPVYLYMGMQQPMSMIGSSRQAEMSMGTIPAGMPLNVPMPYAYYPMQPGETMVGSPYMPQTPYLGEYYKSQHSRFYPMDESNLGLHPGPNSYFLQPPASSGIIPIGISSPEDAAMGFQAPTPR